MTAHATTAAVPTVPVADGLFTWPSDAPQLLAGRCRACGAVAFPRAGSCARCTSEDIEEHRLATRGTLWSWTVQRFAPKEPYRGPEPFVPYGVGYVDLDGEVLVESVLTTADPEELEIGQPMELRIIDAGVRPDGTRTVTFAFAPGRDRP
jgi:uncharacterized OB-fold protein